VSPTQCRGVCSVRFDGVAAGPTLWTKEEDVHIAIARFPAVPAERDKDFRDWFAWSNDQLRATVGLRGRRLLRAPDGSYTALMEHDSASSFAAMRKAEAISMIQHGLGRILSDRRQAIRYDVLVDSPHC
jgi:hypothetical protein